MGDPTEFEQELLHIVRDIASSEEPGQRAERVGGLLDLAERWTGGRSALLPRFVALLADEDSEVRSMAVEGAALCADAGDLAQWDRLSELLRDPEPRLRIQAVHAVGWVAWPRYREALTRLAQTDGVLPVRFEAAMVLASQVDGGGLGALLEGLGHSRLRYNALQALRWLGDPSCREPVRKLFRRWLLGEFDRTQAAGVLARLGDGNAKEHLLRRMSKRRAHDRGLAIELLAELGATEARGPMLELSREAGNVFRGTAAKALGILGDPEALGLLTGLLADEAEDLDVRMDAAEGLLLMGTAPARKALESAARSVSDRGLKDVVQSALELFGGNPAALRRALPLLPRE